MAKINLRKMSLKELLSLTVDVLTAVHLARAKAKNEVRDKLVLTAREHGFSINELFGDADRLTQKTKGAAKYANPEDGTDTWTGRGRRPNWLIARLKSGSTLDEFAI